MSTFDLKTKKVPACIRRRFNWDRVERIGRATSANGSFLTVVLTSGQRYRYQKLSSVTYAAVGA